MPKIHIDKSVLVDAAPEIIFSKLKDFHHWTVWSPWLVTDPDAKVNVNDTGDYYEWEGDVVGAGNMTVEGWEEYKRIDYNLTFLKPWKSKAKIAFVLEPVGNGTRVHWIMDSSLPFFMFWMKKLMMAFVGMDFQRGLTMIKAYIEEGEVHSKLTFNGNQKLEGCTFIGIKTECDIDDLDDKMKDDFEYLMPFVMEHHREKVAGPAFSIYHKWNIVKNNVCYTAAVPVSVVPSDLLDGMFQGTVPTTTFNTVHHKGSYRFVGNAWSAQYARSRGKNKAFKVNRKIDPMEVYLNSPKDTEERQLESEIRFAIKE